MTKLLLLAVGFASLTGCAISTRIPANRFDIPETVGKRWRGDFAAGLEGGNKYVISQDDTFQPPSLFANQGFERSDYDFLMNGNLGVLDHLDIGLKLRPNSTTLGQVKFQFLGDPHATAKEGNFSSAITFALGGAGHELSDSNTFNSTSTHATVSEFDLDAALILGYRPVDWVVLYGGGSWTHRNFNGTVNQTVGTSGSLAYPFSGRMEQVGFNLGLQTESGKFIGRFEYGAASTRILQGSSTFGGYFGAEFGIYW